MACDYRAKWMQVLGTCVRLTGPAGVHNAGHPAIRIPEASQAVVCGFSNGAPIVQAGSIGQCRSEILQVVRLESKWHQHTPSLPNQSCGALAKQHALWALC